MTGLLGTSLERDNQPVLPAQSTLYNYYKVQFKRMYFKADTQQIL